MAVNPTELMIGAGTTYRTDADLHENDGEWSVDFEAAGELLEVLGYNWEADNRVSVSITTTDGFRHGTGRIAGIDTRHRTGRAKITVRGISSLN